MEEFLIELTEEDLSQIAGGLGSAALSFINAAKGVKSATVTATIAQATTVTSAMQAVVATSTSS